MTQDTTLDAFAGTDQSTDQPTEVVGTIETILVSRPAGARCEACDRTVSRLWRDDDGLVCGECTSWARS